MRYARRLAEAGVPVDYRNAKRLTHGFLRAWSVSDDVRAVGAAIIAALRGAFGEAEQPDANTRRATGCGRMSTT